MANLWKVTSDYRHLLRLRRTASNSLDHLRSVTVSSENAFPKKVDSMENSDSSVQIQIGTNLPFEFVLQNTGKSEFSVLLDIAVVIISMETVIQPSPFPSRSESERLKERKSES